jgi:hypothetical protein
MRESLVRVLVVVHKFPMNLIKGVKGISKFKEKFLIIF